MERYFILIIVVTVIGVPTQKKDLPRTDFVGTQRNERIVPATKPFESSAEPIDVLASYTQLQIIAEVKRGKKIYEAIVCGNSIRKMIKNWHSRLDKILERPNPRVLYNILRLSPVGEPFS